MLLPAVLLPAVLLPAVDQVPMRVLGVDEHRYRSVRYWREETGSWRRIEPWITILVDLATGQVLGGVEGRDSAAVGAWLPARSPAWREAIEVVAVDPSAAFRKALRAWLPAAVISVDTFHLVKLANDALTSVRQRLTRARHYRQGSTADASWVHRRLLLRGADTLSEWGWAWLRSVFGTEDVTDELSAAWAVKEQLRRLLDITTIEAAWQERMRLGHYVLTAELPETDRLYATVVVWWEAIEVLVVARATTAKVEAANTGIMNIKRTGRGFHNNPNYTTRILLTSTARTAA